MRFHLFVCDRSLRAEEEARRGGAGNPGTYAMLRAILDLMAGELIGLPDIDPFQIVSETPIFFDSAASIYAAEYRTVNRHIYPST